jgi:hypothetical protein
MLRSMQQFGGAVNGRLLPRAAVALAIALAMAGCATQPTIQTPIEPPDPQQRIEGKPQMFLTGAQLSEVKSIAMGSAHTKGWTLVTETADQIVLQRPMDPTAPQTVALGAAPGSSPVVEVTTDFVEQPGGIIVALAAEVSFTGPDQVPRTIDYTEPYRADLTRSLASLRTTWAGNRERVLAALSSQRAAVQSPEVEDPYGDAQKDLSALPSDPLKAVWAAETTLVDETEPSPTTSQENPLQGDIEPTVTASPTAVASETAPSLQPAPVREPTPSPPSGTGLIALDDVSETGMWAYYAEAYAMTRGCALTDQGAVLIERQPGAEIHDVQCTNRQGFRLRCHNGVCRSLE